MRDRDVINA